ncbi:DUF2878 domain-containing protein [Shewanella sp. Isolate13]|uniref:DUF2878 domain-containing protein n=1 Tax=Shewanella sp. Isolate13 TaxID=2908531 RepID=UPI001EFD1356|nr:DUF2878 domain-containing protein [Shewanella sp. Isolate13]MCG9729892.1 DUF2878 domain-containing protein [Shewanella sp. Isolate13]
MMPNHLIQFAKQHLIVVNLLMFQAVWWLSILYKNSSLWLTIPLLFAHFALSSDVRQDVSLMLKVAIFGFAFDSLLMLAGVFQFQQFPLWLLAIWCHFAISLRYSLAFTQKLTWQFNALLGGIFGCLSYLAGARLEAVVLPLELFYSALILFFVWLVMFPMFVNVSRPQS